MIAVSRDGHRTLSLQSPGALSSQRESPRDESSHRHIGRLIRLKAVTKVVPTSVPLMTTEGRKAQSPDTSNNVDLISDLWGRSLGVILRVTAFGAGPPCPLSARLSVSLVVVVRVFLSG